MKLENVLSFTRCAQKKAVQTVKKHTADLDWQVIQNQMDIFFERWTLSTHNLGSDSAKAQNEYSFLMGFTFCFVFCFSFEAKIWMEGLFDGHFLLSQSLALAKIINFVQSLLPNGLNSKRPFTIFSPDTVFFCHIPSQTLCATFLIRRLQTLKNG